MTNNRSFSHERHPPVQHQVQDVKTIRNFSAVQTIHCIFSFEGFLLVALSCLIKYKAGEKMGSIPVFHLFIQNCKTLDSQFNIFIYKYEIFPLLPIQVEEHAVRQNTTKRN